MSNKNQNYAYINKLQEYAIQHPDWFWSDKEDASKARQYLYNNGASAIVDTIYENTPDSIKKNIDSKKLSNTVKSKQFQQGITDAIDKAGHDYVLPAIIALGGGLAAEAGASSGITRLLGKQVLKTAQAVDNTITKPISHVLEVTMNPAAAKTTVGALAGTATLSSGITDSAALLTDVYERGKQNPSSVNPAEYAMALLTLTPGLDIPQGRKLNSFVSGLKNTPGAIETLISEFNKNPKRAASKYRTMFRDWIEPIEDNLQSKFRVWTKENENTSKILSRTISQKKQDILNQNQYTSKNYADWLNFKLDNFLGFNYDATKKDIARQRHVLAKNNRRAHYWIQNSNMSEQPKTYFRAYKDVVTPKEDKKFEAVTHKKGESKWVYDPYVPDAFVLKYKNSPITIDYDLTFDNWRKSKHLKKTIFHENTHNAILRLEPSKQIGAYSDNASYSFPNYLYSDDFADGQKLTLWQPDDSWKTPRYITDKNGNEVIEKLWVNSPEEWIAEYNGLRNIGATEQMKDFFEQRFGFKDENLNEVLDFAKKYSDKYLYKTIE